MSKNKEKESKSGVNPEEESKKKSGKKGKEGKPKGEKAQLVREEDSNFKHMVRIVGHDITGTRPVHLALTEIEGVGRSLARAIAYKAQVDLRARIGDLDDAEIEVLGEIIEDPLGSGLPGWMVNRRKDYETGQDRHLTGGQIQISLREDIGRERHVRSYRGIRHERGLRVRGQRTRTTGRTGMTVGVKRKSVKMQEAAAGSKKKE